MLGKRDDAYRYPRSAPLDIIDRIHRIAKPSHLAASVPRDVLMRVHFHIKEKLLMGIKTKTPSPVPYTGIQFFPDLSKHTL